MEYHILNLGIGEISLAELNNSLLPVLRKEKELNKSDYLSPLSEQARDSFKDADLDEFFLVRRMGKNSGGILKNCVLARKGYGYSPIFPDVYHKYVFTTIEDKDERAERLAVLDCILELKPAKEGLRNEVISDGGKSIPQTYLNTWIRPHYYSEVEGAEGCHAFI